MRVVGEGVRVVNEGVRVRVVGVSASGSLPHFCPWLTFSFIFRNEFGTHCGHDALVRGNQDLHYRVKELRREGWGGEGVEGRRGEGRGGNDDGEKVNIGGGGKRKTEMGRGGEQREVAGNG